MATITPAAPAGARRAPARGRRGQSRLGAVALDSRGAVFAIEIVYLVMLVGLALAYFMSAAFRGWLPASLGPVPLAVPWWGALGAVLISLSGVFDHRRDWEPGHAYWHYSRIVVGAMLAVVAVIVFIAGILATGSDAATATNAPTGGSDQKELLYYVLAFVVGYREESFRTLVKRVADVVLTPAEPRQRTAAPSGTATASVDDDAPDPASFDAPSREDTR